MDTVMRWKSLAAATVVGITMIATTPAGIASTTSPASRSISGHLTTTRISILLKKSQVKVGERVEIRGTIVPRTARRTVTLQRLQNGRYVKIVSTLTNRSGVAIFHRTFGTTGRVRLRVTVNATATERSATSASVVETVVPVYRLALAPNTQLKPGSSGSSVLLLQQQLTALGYWLGTPNGYFGDATEQAVYALEKAAGINLSGIVGTQFVAAINAGVVPKARTTSGNAIEVDLKHNLVLIVRNGKRAWILNTSTGGGYTYVSGGVASVATTPTGVFKIIRVVDGLDVGPLGGLWRPRYFYSGYAIHGADDVPPVPVSHGCVRVSNEAMNWIWSSNFAPIGSKVWVYA